MTYQGRLLLKVSALLLMGAYALASPEIVVASGGGGACGVCHWQNVPCGGGQTAMNAGCVATCPGTTTGSGCTANDPSCAPIFADGWTCS